ncbi:MAG: vitamin K epoxide reductase family protein [Nanoarchaeota archaeon]
MKKINLLRLLVFLGILGIITSLYLVENHYSPPSEGMWCDINGDVSCSIVNSSVFSEFFNVPVAILGVLWFVFFTLLSWNALKKDNSLVIALFWWSAIGLLFVVYMVAAEVILKAFCPLCTLVHLLVIAVFVCSIVMYKELEVKPASKEYLKTIKVWVISFLAVSLVLFLVFNIKALTEEDYSSLAKCIAEKGINLYSSFLCGHCYQQKQLLGDAFKYINEIECHPEGKNSQTEQCMKKKITGTPTWVMEPNGVEVKRQSGFMTIEELKEFSGCKGD